MANLLQLIVSGLSLGAVYALVALGFVVIYRASQVFNFAQAEFLTVGAFLVVTFGEFGLPWVLALLAAMVVTGLIAAAVERGILRFLVGQPIFVSIILTIFIGSVIRVAVLLIWGTERRGMPLPWPPDADFELFGARILVSSVVAVLAAAGMLALYFVVLKRTRLGIAMRATSIDQESSLALGIPVGRIFGAAWFIAGACAALGGAFLGAFPRTVDAGLGFIALRALPAVIVGGVDSAGGTVVAAFALGLLEVLCQAYVNPALGGFGQNFHTVFPYLIMIVFLIVRPYGIAGRAEIERA
jgi:branched-chain amino acid transport system permease protein